MKVLRDEIAPTLACAGSCAALFTLALAVLLFGCNSEPEWHAVDISGTLPLLDFALTRADDGKMVTADDFRGEVALLYFGYTFCPDICPLTLANVDLDSECPRRTGPGCKGSVRTVDPDRAPSEAYGRATEQGLKGANVVTS